MVRISLWMMDSRYKKSILFLSHFFAFARKKLNPGVAYFVGGSIFKSIIQIIANIFVLAYISPEHMGIWNSILLFQTYSVFVQIGVINGFNREYPYEIGRENRDSARLLAETALAYTLLAIILVLIAGSLAYLILDSSSRILNISLLVIVIITAMRFYEQYLAATFRSNQAFKSLGKVYIIRGIFGLATLPLVIYYLYHGYLIRILLTTCVTLLLMHLIRPVRVKIRFSKQHFITMFKYGVYIFILSYIFTSSETIDRILLLKFKGHEYVGYYTVAFMAYNAFRMIPTTIANYIYPRLSIAIGRNEDMSVLWTKVMLTNLSMLLILLPLACLGLLVIPYIIKEYFPMYVMGISATQIILFAGVFSF